MIEELIAFMLSVTLLIAGAAVTGKLPELCEHLGGTYQPAGPDACPDADWSRLFKIEKNEAAAIP